jgi:hypothetical protein
VTAEVGVSYVFQVYGAEGSAGVVHARINTHGGNDDFTR